jgi:hypothetical protein
VFALVCSSPTSTPAIGVVVNELTVPLIGDMVYLHDSVTKASSKNRMRWCMVIAINGSQTRVAPRSASVPGPVHTAAGLLREFTMEGWFSRWTLPVATVDVGGARNIGQLPEPARSQVLALFKRSKRRGRHQP